MKKAISILITAVMIISMLGAFSVSAATVTVINTPEQFLAIADNPFASYKLGSDIVMDAYTVTKPIAETFSGTLDGNGHTVSGLKLFAEGDKIALFGKITGSVSNLYLSGSIKLDCNADAYIGTLALGLVGGKIDTVSVDMTIDSKSDDAKIGGFVSYMSGDAVIENCEMNGTISSDSYSDRSYQYLGGIASGLETKGAKIINCTNNARIETKGSDIFSVYAGGILASSVVYMSNPRQFEINSCSNKGDIDVVSTGDAFAGGITSIIANYSFINRSENRGEINAAVLESGFESKSGGIVADASGTENGGSVVNCANYGVVNEADYFGGIVGKIIGKTFKYNFSAQGELFGNIKSYDNLEKHLIFENNYKGIQDSYAGFDFEKIWKLEGGMPVLRNVGAVKKPQTDPCANGHSFGEYVYNNDATYEKDGTKTRTCLFCEKSETVTAEGTKLEKPQTDPCANGHSFGEYVYNNDATYEKDGTKTRTCSVCKKTETVTAEGTKLVKPLPEMIDSSKKFDDVPAKAWYKPFVDYAVTYKIFGGKTDKIFEPEANITRAEFVQVLANLTGIDTTNKKVATKFKDVKSGQWFAPAVKWASDNAIVAGKNETSFDPNAKITREEMCVMLVNYAKFKGITFNNKESKQIFADDAKISSWAKERVYMCQTADIVNGKGANKFDPTGSALRCEVATLFKNFHQDYIA